MRIAFGRIAQESNALSPVVTTMEDFERTHLLQGDELLAACAPDGFEAKGFLRDAELSGFVRAAREAGDVELVPLISAWTVPGGPIERATLDSLIERLVAALRAAGPVDGVMLSLHGAMASVDSREPESEIVAAVRAVVGRKARIGITLDLHADLTPNKLRDVDVLAAYQTNPHRDHARTGERCGRTLIAAIGGAAKLTTAWRSLPMVIGGGVTLDFLPPMLPIFWRMRTLERRVPNVLLTNVFMSHLWLDSPELGWAVHVTTHNDQALADRIADELADRLWATRFADPPSMPNADEAIEAARQARWARKLGIVAMCDASDVVGAGAPGDRTELLRAALERGRDLQWLVPIRDPAALHQLSTTRIGAEVTMPLGATLDANHSRPIEVRGVLRRFELTEAFGRVAVLDLGHVQVVVTEGAPLAMNPEFYTDRGLDVWKADVVVVKSFFPFRIYFAKMLRKAIYVRTGGGTTDLDAWRRVTFARPTWPASNPGDWRAADRDRRADVVPS